MPASVVTVSLCLLEARSLESQLLSLLGPSPLAFHVAGFCPTCGYHSSGVFNRRFSWGVSAHTDGVPCSRSGISRTTVSLCHPFPFWFLLLVEAEWPLLSLVGLEVSRPHVSVHLCLPTARPKSISGQTTRCHPLGATSGLDGRWNAFWLWSRARRCFS